MMHIGSRDLYNDVVKNLPMLDYTKWDRMSMVGLLADLATSACDGAMLEIGAGESSIYINRVSEKRNRRAFYCDIQMGIFTNAFTVSGYFREDRIIISEKDERTPEIGNHQCVVYGGSSDSFFDRIKLGSLSFAFIDGDHVYKQVRKDFYNVLPLMQYRGLLVLHDTYPPDEEYLGESKCGTVYGLRREIEQRKDLNVFTFLGTALGVGLTVVRRKAPDLPFYQI